MRDRLSDSERADALTRIPDWRMVDGRDAIEREFQFPDFAAAFDIMTAIAAEAERMDHHPDWFNSYGRLHITLTSHDVDGLSGRDIALAGFIDDLVAGGE